jgi:hypothetical protein
MNATDIQQDSSNLIVTFLEDTILWILHIPDHLYHYISSHYKYSIYTDGFL